MFRAAYALPAGIPATSRLQALYQDNLPAGDPLSVLLHPFDQGGEVNAWGGAHITMLHALTTRDPATFDRIVRDVCGSFAPPELAATELKFRKPRVLPVHFESPTLREERKALIEATRACIERSPLARYSTKAKVTCAKPLERRAIRPHNVRIDRLGSGNQPGVALAHPTGCATLQQSAPPRLRKM